MLAEVLANPTALPLWAAALFAVSLYPLGLLLPGCPCCGVGCPTCGTGSTAQEQLDSANGRLCCSGEIAPSITVRLTSVGPATLVERTAPGENGVYTRYTSSCSCLDWQADYVLSLRRGAFGQLPCSWSLLPWSYNCSDRFEMGLFPRNSKLVPGTAMPDEPFPEYWLAFPMWGNLFCSRTVQQCSGFPDIESCNVGFSFSGRGDMMYTQDVNLKRFGPQCDPRGLVISEDAVFNGPSGFCDGRLPTPPFAAACRFRIEILPP